MATKEMQCAQIRFAAPCNLFTESPVYLIGINLPGRNLPIFEKGGKFLPGDLKHGQVMERRLKKKSSTLTMMMTEIL